MMSLESMCCFPLAFIDELGSVWIEIDDHVDDLRLTEEEEELWLMFFPQLGSSFTWVTRVVA